jgi:hypothetical protein
LTKIAVFSVTHQVPAKADIRWVKKRLGEQFMCIKQLTQAKFFGPDLDCPCGACACRSIIIRTARQPPVLHAAIEAASG